MGSTGFEAIGGRHQEQKEALSSLKSSKQLEEVTPVAGQYETTMTSQQVPSSLEVLPPTPFFGVPFLQLWPLTHSVCRKAPSSVTVRMEAINRETEAFFGSV